MRQADIAIIGGGMGGVAAALAACEAGASVLLSEPTDWLGGQMTSQGTSALDEHPLIEQVGGTRSYMQLRERIRDHYRARYGIQRMPDGSPLNPGNGWVSRLCFEPAVGARAIEAMLAPHIASGRLRLLLQHAPADAVLDGDQIRSVSLRRCDDPEAPPQQVAAAIFLDATELGDLLPLVRAESVTGAESGEETGEPLAAPGPARPTEVQSFTFPFAVERCPGERHTTPRPPGYEQMRDQQPFTLTLAHRDGPPRPFRMFIAGPTGLPPFWTYRRILDGALLDPTGQTRDIAMINWPGNDFRGGDLVNADTEGRARLLESARQLSLAFLHWLQTECPRDEGDGCGYPELRLVPETMGGVHGLAKAPYVREARRIVARQRILAHEILRDPGGSVQPTDLADSVGIGWYHMDLHPAYGNPRDLYEPTRPFQIPLGALIPVQVANLLACCKNIGTTHLTNGAYRLHPVEWNIGESAGTLAALCVAARCTPASVADDPRAVSRLQGLLADRGVPITWPRDRMYDLGGM